MKKRTLGVLLSLAFSLPALSQEPQCRSRMQELVAQSGYTIRLIQPCKAWSATNSLGIPRALGTKDQLLFAEEGELGLVGVQVQSKAQLNLTSALMLKLLKLNSVMDYVKVGIDHDGDLFVRAEFHLPTISPAEFNDTVKQVVAASTKVYNALKE